MNGLIGGPATPLDTRFLPFAAFLRKAECAARDTRDVRRIGLAMEREDGVGRHDLVLPAALPNAARLVERVAKFLLWSAGGHRLRVQAPPDLSAFVATAYAPAGARAEDARLMTRAYGRRFEVVLHAESDELPPARDSELSIGGHWDGCRIGFDLGASDYKLAALRDGEVVFSAEVPWNPREQSDPAYHRAVLADGLRRAASHLPRVDAIGGSSAGIIVRNEPRLASLFRAVPDRLFAPGVRDIFRDLAAEWKAPIAVLNDGDVTALAGALSLGRSAVLGLAMGSSQAAGYVARNGRLTGRLCELALAPVDLHPAAPPDDWTRDCGCGGAYFSQQAVSRLMPAANIAVPDAMPQPERLRTVQDLMTRGDERAAAIYRTIGIYLGWTIPLYRRFYDFDTLMLLGRVLSGAGGETLVAAARSVLAEEFPETAACVEIVVPDERTRRVGQAVAAASLPEAGG